MIEALECLAPLAELAGTLLEIGAEVGLEILTSSVAAAASRPPPRRETVVDLGDITHQCAQTWRNFKPPGSPTL
jgi:hypothetical protein